MLEDIIQIVQSVSKQTTQPFKTNVKTSENCPKHRNAPEEDFLRAQCHSVVQKVRMPSSCVVPHCTTPRGNVGFYRFPPDMREKWANSISLPLEKLTKSSQVCRRHFSTSDFLKKKLKPQSIPTLNLPVSQFWT